MTRVKTLNMKFHKNPYSPFCCTCRKGQTVRYHDKNSQKRIVETSICGYPKYKIWHSYNTSLIKMAVDKNYLL